MRVKPASRNRGMAETPSNGRPAYPTLTAAILRGEGHARFGRLPPRRVRDAQPRRNPDRPRLGHRPARPDPGEVADRLGDRDVSAVRPVPGVPTTPARPRGDGAGPA